MLAMMALLAACSMRRLFAQQHGLTNYKLMGKVTTLTDTLTILTTRQKGFDTVLINQQVNNDSFSLPVSFQTGGRRALFPYQLIARHGVGEQDQRAPFRVGGLWDSTISTPFGACAIRAMPSTLSSSKNKEVNMMSPSSISTFILRSIASSLLLLTMVAGRAHRYRIARPSRRSCASKD
jgi:hypothetical protein